MNSIQSYRLGFLTLLKSVRLNFLIWAVYLVIMLLLAIPLVGIFDAAAGNSLLPASLAGGFDATVITELLRNGGSGMLFYVNGLLPWILAFFLLQVFLNGGIMSWIANPRGKFTIGGFTRGSARFFWRFLKLALYMLVIHVILGLILYLPWLLVTGSKTGLTDKQLVQPVLFIAGIHLLLLVPILMAGDIARSGIFRSDSRKVLRTLLKSFGQVLRTLPGTFLLGLLLLVVPVLLFTLFYLFRIAVPADTGLMVLLLFLAQQLFIFIRISTRIWRLSSVYRYQAALAGKS